MTNNIFDVDEIIVVNEEPINYTSFVDWEKFLADSGKLNKCTTNNKTGDIIYYVDCPNEKSHGGTSVTATMIFVCEDMGEKNPYFLCHHSQCKHLQLQDFLNSCSNIDIKNYIDKEKYDKFFDKNSLQIEKKKNTDSEEQQDLASHIAFYGYDTEGFYYFGSSDSYLLLKLKAADLTEKNMYSIYSNQNDWFLAFADMTKDKQVMYWSNAALWLIQRSKYAGPFKAKMVRYLGIHQENEEFVLNTGTNVRLQSGETITYHQARDIFKKSLYLPTQTDICISEHEATKNDLNNLVDIINELPFTSDTDRIKFLGILICGLVPGSLENRPNGWLNAEAGSGKTQIFALIVSIIWKASGALICDKNTTLAGIEQHSKGSNISVAHDEAEASGDVAIRKIEAILEGVLSSSTNGNGETLKGGAHGTPQSYKSKHCYLFGAIADKVDNPALKRRIALMRLHSAEEEIYKTKYKMQWPKLKQKIKSIINENFAERFYLYWLNRLHLLNKNVANVENWLINNSSLGSEILGLYAPIFSAYLMLQIDREITDNDISPINNVLLDIEKEYKSQEKEKNTGVLLFNQLLEIGTIRTTDNKNIHISDLILLHFGKENFANPLGFTIQIATDLLAKCGLKVLVECESLVISNNHQWLKTFFGRLGHSNHGGRLKSYPGSTQTEGTVNFSRSGSRRGIVIPLPHDFLKGSKPEISIPSIFENDIIIDK